MNDNAVPVNADGAHQNTNSDNNSSPLNHAHMNGHDVVRLIFFFFIFS